MIYVFVESAASILLGALIIQLVAEPAPISSSTHVRIFLDVVGRDTVPHLFGALLMASLGMLILLAFAYRDSLKRLTADYWSYEGLWFCVHGAWTTLLIPLALGAKMLFGLPESTPVRLLATALLLVVADLFPVLRKKPVLHDAVWVGIAQSIALYCGTSRLATTYFFGRARGLSGSVSLALSWILAIPFYAGTGVIGLVASYYDAPDLFSPHALIAIAGALLLGYGLLRSVMRSAARERMGWWALYLVPLALAVALLPGT